MVFPGASLVHSGLGGEQLMGGFSCIVLFGKWVHPSTGRKDKAGASTASSQSLRQFDCICCHGSGLLEDDGEYGSEGVWSGLEGCGTTKCKQKCKGQKMTEGSYILLKEQENKEMYMNEDTVI